MKGKWIDLINESVHTMDDIDIGDIDAVYLPLNGLVESYLLFEINVLILVCG
jgi:hypothetical protein